MLLSTDYPLIELPVSHVEEFRKCVNNNRHLILNNEPYDKNWNILCACMDRIEDTAKYLNSKKLGQKQVCSCAFDLMEFLSHSALLLDCIDIIIKIFKAENKIQMSDIIFKEKEVTNQNALNKRLAKIRENKPYKNEDDLYFEYIRSIGAIHPNGTDRHPYFQQYAKETSPFLIWNHLIGVADGDISLHIYDSDGKGGICSLRLRLAEIYDYVLDRYNRIPILNDILNSHIAHLVTKMKNQKLLSREDFNNYGEYISYLKVEARKRSEYVESYIDDAAKMICISGVPQGIALKYSKYRNALIYAVDNLRELLQAPILEDDFNEDILIAELRLPSLLYEDRIAEVDYYYEKASYLYDEDGYGYGYGYEVDWFRNQAKNLYGFVNEYAFVDNESLDKLDNYQLLAVLNTALYFYALEHDTFINETIPRTETYR